MTLIKKPVTGMKDILPKEMRFRNDCMKRIHEVYKSFGYEMIETPVVESLENLTSKQGGDNEKLIFRILKRGEKLKIDQAKTPDDLSDSGLRYDLTVPLVRFYSAHKDELPVPFKAIQTGNVFRADRPQRGRFRQFRQYDIDIIGEPGPLAEIDLIYATSTAVASLGLSAFTIRISDRRILNAVSACFGFPEEAFESVCIVLDKLDKIGMDGVYRELCEVGEAHGIAGERMPSKEEIESLFAIAKSGEDRDPVEAVRAFCDRLAERIPVDTEAVENLCTILTGVRHTACGGTLPAKVRILFDPTLVRGMGYYTGTIFEIGAEGYEGSIGGGGRYDRMIGKFTGQEVAACGFSLGFERIMLLLMEQSEDVPGEKEKVAVLIERGMDMERVSREILAGEGKTASSADGKDLSFDRTREDVLVVYMNKNKRHQKEQLRALGYTRFIEYYND